MNTENKITINNLIYALLFLTFGILLFAPYHQWDCKKYYKYSHKNRGVQRRESSINIKSIIYINIYHRQYQNSCKNEQEIFYFW